MVLPISGVHSGVLEALRYACSISDDVTAVYVEITPAETEKVRQEWKTWVSDVTLVVVPSPYRSTLRPLLEFLEKTDQEHHDGQYATVVLPEFIPAHRWQYLLHNQSAALLKLDLLYQRRRQSHPRVVVDVPYYLED